MNQDIYLTFKEGAAKEFSINLFHVKKAANILLSLRHPMRIRILKLLNERQPDGLTVTDIQIILDIPQYMASQHLAILRNSGLMKTQKNGYFTLYTINFKKLKALHENILFLIS